jgi:hypothetical protein
MATSCTPLSDWMLGPYQPYLRNACFVAGCLEREQWLNLEGLYAYWIRATTAWLDRPPSSWSAEASRGRYFGEIGE